MRRVLPAVIVLGLCAAASGKIALSSALDNASASDLVFHGMVVEVAADSAVVKVEGVLHGKAGATVRVSPITIEYCIGNPPNFKRGEKVLLFAKSNPGNDGDTTVAVVDSGHGKITLDAATQDARIAAARRFLEIAALKTADEKHVAMLREARSKNEWLRREAHNYISMELTRGETANRYQKELGALLDDASPEVQRAGLNGLRFVPADDLVPRMIELSRSKDAGVVDSASLALARYDTAESAAALIALTKHESPEVRKRARIDLSNSRRAESKLALAGLLDDKNKTVRATAPGGLVFLLRAGKADDLIPRLAGLLRNPDEVARASAADALGETRSTEAVPPLLEVLATFPNDKELRRQLMSALYRHYTKSGKGAQQLIDDKMELIVAKVKSDEKESYGPAFQGIGILAASATPEAKAGLRWAAQSHPNAEIRTYAKRSLGQVP